MSKDTRPYFVMTNEYPRHRKIRPLSDKAFRLHVTLIGMCNEDRNDGNLAKHDLHQLGPKPAKELIQAGLVIANPDGSYQMHDYLHHQKSRAELEQLGNKRSDAASYGNHVKHHEKKNIVKEGCPHCPQEPEPDHTETMAALASWGT